MTASGVNIDKTAPTISLSKPSEGDFYFLKQALTVDYSRGDSLSGMTNCTGTASSGTPLDTTSAGAKTFVVSSTDMAGNITTKTVSYAIGYNLGLLYDQTKPHSSGSNVAIKLQLNVRNWKGPGFGRGLSSSSLQVT